MLERLVFRQWAATVCSVTTSTTSRCTSVGTVSFLVLSWLSPLQANFKLLQDLDCSRDSLETLSPLAASLIQPFLRHHASKDVRLLAACCVAEIFNVFFPDPPYDEEQLKVSRVHVGLRHTSVTASLVPRRKGGEKSLSPPQRAWERGCMTA